MQTVRLASARQRNRCVLVRFAEDAGRSVDGVGIIMAEDVERSEGTRPQAYGRLLDSALDGDQRLFARNDGVEKAWGVVAPALNSDAPAVAYEPGSGGFSEADDLIAGAAGWHCPDVS